MRRVTIESLRLRNFRGAKDVTANFGPGMNVVSGDNGTGKTTLHNAFIWLLFGKALDGDKDYYVFPIEDGERARKVDASVEGVFVIDGKKVLLQRVFSEKWTKPRGETELRFDGCESKLFINGVPKRVGDFNSFISENIAPADVFKYLTDARGFISLPWETRRKKLFELAGDVDLEAVAKSVPGYTDLLQRLSDKSESDYRKEIAARKKKAAKELAEIPARIKQTRALMPEIDTDEEHWQKALEAVNDEISKQQQAATDIAASERDAQEKIRAKVSEVESLKTEMMKRESELKREAEKEADEKNAERRKLERECKDAEEKVKEAERAYGRAERLWVDLDSKTEDLKEKREALLTAFFSERDKVYPGAGLCPHCGQTLPENMQAESLEKFNQNKAAVLKHINQKGEFISKEIEANKKQQEEAKTDVEKKAGEVLAASNQFEELKRKMAEAPEAVTAAEVDPMTDPEYKAISERLDALQLELKAVKLTAEVSENWNDGKAVRERLEELNRRRDQCLVELEKFKTVKRYKEECERLEKEERELSQTIADIERDEDTIQKHSRALIEAMTDKVNGLFRMVSFKFVETTIDGGEKDICEPYVDGKPFSVANNALRVHGCLDIVNTLQRETGISVPVFCDEAESLTTFPECDFQTILLRVVKGVKPLQIKVL